MLKNKNLKINFILKKIFFFKFDQEKPITLEQETAAAI